MAARALGLHTPGLGGTALPGLDWPSLLNSICPLLRVRPRQCACPLSGAVAPRACRLQVRHCHVGAQSPSAQPCTAGCCLGSCCLVKSEPEARRLEASERSSLGLQHTGLPSPGAALGLQQDRTAQGLAPLPAA